MLDSEEPSIKTSPPIAIEGNFKGTQIQFFLQEGEEVVSLQNLSDALEYDKLWKAYRLLERNEGEVGEYIRKISQHQSGALQGEDMFLTEIGAILFIMKSGQPLAIELRRWIAQLVSHYRKQRLQLKEQDPVTFYLEAVKAALAEINQHSKQLVYHEERIEQLEEDYLTKTITVPNQEVLHAKIRRIVELTGLSYVRIWDDLNEHFQLPKPKSRIARYKFLPDAKFGEACSYLDGYLESNLSHRTLDHFERKTKKN